MTRIVRWLESRRRLITWCALPALVLMVAGVFAFVYYTGGIKYVFSHSMYVPIVLGGLIFGFWGGIVFGALGGLTLGPFMPIDVATGEMQEALNWLYRAGFFCLIGGLAGAASDSVRWYVRSLRWAMHHDHATGLPNRAALVAELDRNRHEPDDGAGSRILVMVSLENAEELNIAFGADSTDVLIGEMAGRLGVLVHDEDLVFRVERERLCLLLDSTGQANAEDPLNHLSSLFAEPIEHEGLSLHADVQTGMVRLDGRQSDANQALRTAEAALVLARERAEEGMMTIEDVESYSRENVSLLGQLRQALRSGQLEMHYQPKIELPSGRVAGVEALMRWRHPEQGMIPPDKFIPRAEQSTLIDDLTGFAVTQALDQLLEWQRDDIRLTMAVNVSARNLMNPEFGEMVREQLASRGLDGSHLELEVTEGALMRDIARVSELLHDLSGMNVMMSIDDFGTGYSSLQYMNNLPVSVIKIDQIFVRPLPDDTGASHIVNATIDLSHRLEMEVVAEGVENHDTLKMLCKMGCDRAQGFHIARPMPGDDLAGWVRDYDGRFAVLQ